MHSPTSILFSLAFWPTGMLVKMSEIWTSPPSFRTRNISLKTRSLSFERLMTQFDITISTELSLIPTDLRSSIIPFLNSTDDESGNV